MAYSTDNPPALVHQRVGASAGAHWVYHSTDPIATVRVDGYFSNGYELGMRRLDTIMVVDTDASPPAAQLCIVVQAEEDGTVDISDGTAVTATDTD
jgi:homogentisate 1,2-dioxygenase